MLRSKSQEAVVQAKLAEVGLLRARIPAFIYAPNKIEQLSNDGKCFNFFTNLPNDRLHDIVDETESRLLTLLDEINKRNQKRRTQRMEKRRYKYPIVAVVGYTNAGKTSLIRVLSGSKKLKSSPNVFATLDITHHLGRLETNIFNDHGIGLPGFQLMLLDTIGFMSDIPTNLISAFRATLNECLDSDLIIHVVDISFSNWKSKMKHVEESLKCLSEESTNVNGRNLPFVMKIANKIDLIPDTKDLDKYDGFDAFISAENQIGIYNLAKTVQTLLIKQLGWCERTVIINQGSATLQWIYANAMVTDLRVSLEDSQFLLVTAVYTLENWKKYNSYFHDGVVD